MSIQEDDFNWFPEYSEDVRTFLTSLMNFMMDITLYNVVVQGNAAIVGSLFNFLHMIVLSRMKTSSINVIMLGMAVADFFNMLLLAIYSQSVISTFGECSPPPALILHYIELAIEAFRDDFRRCSTWFGVFMALLRFLILRFIKHSGQLSNPKMGRRVLIGCFLSSSVISLCSFLQYKFEFLVDWTPPESCPAQVQNVTSPMYYSDYSQLFSFWNYLPVYVFRSVDALASKFVPCVALPLLTVLLCLELRKTLKKRKNARTFSSKGKEDKNHTTAIVILMTVMFVVSELPLGLAKVAMVISKQAGVLQIFESFPFLFNIVFIFNSSIHCLLFFLMSSQYRDTVKSLLRLKK